MSDNVYAVTELVGTSETSIEDAISGAIGRASETIDNLDWFEMTDLRGHIDGNKVKHFQVTIRLGFRHDPKSA
ncbi:dodecin flavoprotein [Pacificimonas flava]|uniref:Dodecin flavoprotein n=2 Tax=Pacificimonas TaxID=1960290 RepID=A0A219B281_9SPHN|nr:MULTISPECIES: dodecin [Pacificimonas]MBZ6378128.1 dodecin domain-containing protein [Pacificimonas aurantium]OWV32236.1 dodecin flavoprotein [Pacificimonas flava]